MELAMINEKIVPLDEAMVSAHDRGFYFGDGVYEVVLARNGSLFAHQAHLERFENSLRKLDMLDKVDIKVIDQRIQEAFTAAKLPDALVYYHITRGPQLRKHDYGDDWTPSFMLTIRDYGPERPESIRTITHADWRWKRCDIKSLNLLANIMAKREAVKQGAYEAVLIDDNGLVTEATSATIMMIKDRILQTAPLTANILPGITRRILLDWAPELGLTVKEESFTPREMINADELLITGTGNLVMGITHVDNDIIGSGAIGTYTAIFKQRLDEAILG